MKAPRYFIELQSYTELQIQDILNINAVEYKRLEVFLLENDFLRLDIQHYKKFHFVGVLAYEKYMPLNCSRYY